MPLRALIVDDEPLARAMIREYLEAVPDVEVLGECGNGSQALQAIEAQRPDLVFLDVQMPGLSGFDVLERLDHPPRIIFSTAYDTFAIKAFEAGAVDYLLKPYSRARFQKAMERVLGQRPAQPAQAQQLEQLLALLQKRPDQREIPDHLFVRAGDQVVPVDTKEVLWIEAAGDYARLHTAERTYLCSLGIGALEARLDARRFLRVHRSAIVAVGALERLVSDGEGGYVATLRGGRTVRVSRSYAPKIRERIF